MVTECTICKTKESKTWLGKGGGTYCQDCSKDISDFQFQPENKFNVELLTEVFFRRGKGEKITYKELHTKRCDLKFIEFMELLKISKRKE